MKLTDPTDEELNAAFAEKVAGYTMHLAPGAEWRVKEIPHFTTSADAVLPWLEKRRWVKGDVDRDQDGGLYVEVGGGEWAGCEEKFSFAKQAVIALLRAHGVEVIFTAK